MNAQDQADNLYASSIGPIPSLNDFDPTNHTVRERPEDLNQHDLDLRKNQEEPSPSKSGRNRLRPAYARKSGSRRNRLRLVYALKSSKSLLSRAIDRRRDGNTSCVARFWDLNSQSWVGTRPISENNSNADAKSFPCQAELTPKSGRTLKNRTHELERMCGVPSLVFYYNPSTRCWTGQAYMPSNQPTPDWNCVLDTL